MVVSEESPIDPSVLGAASRRLLEAIAEFLPELLPHARAKQFEETDGLSLFIKVQSPTGDSERVMEIWSQGKSGEPSIGFGPSHYHEYADEEGIAGLIEWARAIFDDEVVIFLELGGEGFPRHYWVDLCDPDELLDELRSPRSSGRARLTSWTGAADREVSTQSLDGG